MTVFDRIRARFVPRRTPTLDELTAENRRRYAAQHARLAENLRQCEDMTYLNQVALVRKLSEDLYS